MKRSGSIASVEKMRDENPDKLAEFVLGKE